MNPEAVLMPIKKDTSLSQRKAVDTFLDEEGITVKNFQEKYVGGHEDAQRYQLFSGLNKMLSIFSECLIFNFCQESLI